MSKCRRRDLDPSARDTSHFGSIRALHHSTFYYARVTPTCAARGRFLQAHGHKDTRTISILERHRAQCCSPSPHRCARSSISSSILTQSISYCPHFSQTRLRAFWKSSERVGSSSRVWSATSAMIGRVVAAPNCAHRAQKFIGYFSPLPN